MYKDPLPESNHIVRHCRPRYVENGWPLPAAFELRKDSKTGEIEEYASVNWLEYFEKENKHENMRAVIKELDKHLTLSSSQRLATLNVGETIDHVRQYTPDHRLLSILHTPRNTDSHSGIYNLKYEDTLVCSLILEKVLDCVSPV